MIYEKWYIQIQIYPNKYNNFIVYFYLVCLFFLNCFYFCKVKGWCYILLIDLLIFIWKYVTNIHYYVLVCDMLLYGLSYVWWCVWCMYISMCILFVHCSHLFIYMYIYYIEMYIYMYIETINLVIYCIACVSHTRIVHESLYWKGWFFLFFFKRRIKHDFSDVYRRKWRGIFYIIRCIL